MYLLNREEIQTLLNALTACNTHVYLKLTNERKGAVKRLQAKGFVAQTPDLKRWFVTEDGFALAGFFDSVGEAVHEIISRQR